AVNEAEAERATAGKNLEGACKDLGGKLQHAAGRYEQADAEGKANIDKQMPPR
ncbi:MAG: ESX-1 secretion-associated protein, partial [Actinobacteria bacterium]|nr:ESX-1 secretion-associated protein [Actinomycetota bacterium]